MPQSIAYIDCFSGASGDMLLGAFLDAGLDLAALEEDLAHLGLTDYELRTVGQTRHGITGTQFNVIDRGHDRPARNLPAVEGIIGESGLPDGVVERSLRVFRRLAQAEARIHGTTVEDVHFHEIGAVDSLIDIVGFCCALHRFEIEALHASPLPLGSGTIRTEHGQLPVPVPATLALLAEAHAPTVPSPATTEIVTPTGAALLTTLATFSRPAMRVNAVGYGFGQKEFAWPNMVRVWLGQAIEDRPPQQHEHGPWSAPDHEEHGDHDHDHAHEHRHHHHHDDESA